MEAEVPTSAVAASVAAVRAAEATGVKTVKGRALEVPPPGAGVNTVTCADPAEEIKEAGTEPVIPAGLLNIVVSGVGVVWPPGVHWTTEHGNKLVPVTSRGNAAPPAGALLVESEVIAGTGRSVEGAAIEKFIEFEVTAELDTVIATVP